MNTKKPERMVQEKGGENNASPSMVRQLWDEGLT